MRGRKLRSQVVLSALAVLLVGPGCESERAAPPPSIIVVLVDTLRADYLGFHGFAGAISPNLDRLATESIVFDRAYSQAPWTKPAIASLFTGLEVPVHRVLTHRGQYGAPDEPRAGAAVETDILPPGAETLAESLSVAGYETAAFVANPWIRRAHGFAQGFAHFDERFVANDTPADKILDAARAWLAERDGAKPFFLYLHLMDVHDPYDAPDADVEAVRSSPSLGEDRRLERTQLPPGMMAGMTARRVPWVQTEAVLSLREWRARYAAGVHAFDRRFGPFVDELRESGQLDQAVLIVTSDHGEELFEHGDWAHGKNLHNHQLQIPLLVRLPHAAEAGRRVDSLAALIDVMPTVLGLAGVDVPEVVQGQDLGAQLRGDKGVQREAVFASGVKWHPERHALQSREHKLIKDVVAGGIALYDSVGDPGEQNEIAESQPVEAFQLSEALDRHLAVAVQHPGIGRASAEIDPQVQERLRSLGYLE